MDDRLIFDIETIEESSQTERAVQEQIDGGSELQIQVETISEQKEVSSSLCDRFGIHMFTEEFIEAEGKLAASESSEKQAILENVMMNMEDYTLLDDLQTVMKAKTETIIKKDYENEKGTESFTILAAYGIVGAVLAGCVLFYIDKFRKGRKNIENNSDIPQLQDRPGV